MQLKSFKFFISYHVLNFNSTNVTQKIKIKKNNFKFCKINFKVYICDMKVQGKIFKKLPVVKGVSNSGKDWIKQDFVIETTEQYPKKIAFSTLGQDKIDILAKLNVNDLVDVSINLESREYNEKWYTNVNAWRIDKVSNDDKQSEPKQAEPKPAEDSQELPF